MCLVTFQKEPFIAQKDMIVFKTVRIMNGKLIPSIFTDFWQYVIGALNETKIERIYKNISFADNIASKYFKEKYKIPSTSDILLLGAWAIGPGFHSYKHIARDTYLYGNQTLVKCTIPAGSEYFEDPTGLVVSNKIIVDKILYYGVNGDITKIDFEKLFENNPELDNTVYYNMADTLQELIQSNPQDYTP
jgi:hypothetical protein